MNIRTTWAYLTIKFEMRNCFSGAVVGARLVEHLLPIPEVQGSNLVIAKNLYWTFSVNCIEKTKIKKNRPGMAHLKNLITTWSCLFDNKIGADNCCDYERWWLLLLLSVFWTWKNILQKFVQSKPFVSCFVLTATSLQTHWSIKYLLVSQCDQIGLFWKISVTIYPTKVSHLSGDFLNKNFHG